MNFTKLSFATWMLVIAASCFASQDSVKVVKGQVSDYYIPVVNEYELTGIVTDEHDQPLGRPSSFANDEEMLDYIEKTHLNYMWDGANPNSGLAPERIHLDGIYPQNDKHVVTTGGSGFGIAGLLAGIDRGYISRIEGVQRLTKIVDFLGKADRFHGVWSHWIDGNTGKTVPFGQKDDGGDLVESSFLMASLLCVRQYFENGNEQEKLLASNIDKLWKEIDENGEVEMFSQSEKTDPYERERPAARLFTATDKNYQSIIKQLNELTPPSTTKGKLAGLMDDE